jgi:protein-tyrosine phosphatase
MAEVVMASLWPEDVISSAGTANWHVGTEMDVRARGALDRAGFFGAGSLAELATPAWIDTQDLVVVMTREQRDDVRSRRAGTVDVVLLRALLGDENVDLADPYYGDDDEFDACLATIIQSCRVLSQSPRPAPGRSLRPRPGTSGE